MKKFLSGILSLAMLITLVSCGQTQTSTTSQAQSAGNGEKQQTLDWPKETIRIIVPYSAGGTGDLMSRTQAEYISEMLGVSVVVDNKTGGSGAVAVADLLSNDPDGYTIMESAIGPVVLTPLISDVDYTTDDLRPISSITEAPMVLVVNAESGIDSVDDLLAKASENPGVMTYATPAAGSIQNVTMESIFNDMGKNGLMTHVPYDGGSQAIVGLIGNQIDACLVVWSDVKANVEAGYIKVLAQCGAERRDYLADIPTLQECGIDVVSTMWSGYVCSADVPDEVVQILNDAFKASVEDPDTAQILVNLGSDIVFRDSETFAADLADEVTMFSEVIANMG